MNIEEDWKKYLQYLKEWAENHSGNEYIGCSPVCFDEFETNENEEC